ncbi:MAG: 1-(5-phosphoribosyl)-5-[Bacteroidales bacterium]|nr:1-(5-phosphoribosyl)-5-[(5-phosphoribosylamino)methylideneamino]imidazole-4-carboxamide isomerase [Bacteroidales bacterium]
MIEIIPAIDLIDGKCVRLSQGDYSKCKIYSGNPLDIAKEFEDCGVKMLHIVDLDGAKSSAPINLRVLEKIASHTGLKLEFGGGIKCSDALKKAFDAGAYRVICGSIACNEPEIFLEWLDHYGAEKLVFGADLKDGKPAVAGWLELGNASIESLLDRFIEKGLRTAIVTDISRDGMLAGPSFELYEKLMENYKELDIIASGGVRGLKDITKLNEMGIKEVIVGKAIYEGRITLKELEKFINAI